MTAVRDQNRAAMTRHRQALYNGDLVALKAEARALFNPDAMVQLGYPFETLTGPDALVDGVFADLLHAIPDLERRDHIVISGTTADDAQWVGCSGLYTGTFRKPWLEIPPTGHIVSMRFHEFYRFESNRVCEIQAVWDIPELMLQAGVWPMTPSLGREWNVPGPATQDGLSASGRRDAQANASYQLVLDMLNGLGKSAEGGVAAMQLEKYWHPHFNWYGPSGIGTSRGIQGFRNWHQIPFLNAMPDRVGSASAGNLFADGNYVGFTAWPGMHMTISGDGWLGIAPADQKITMRSLDFWRCENGTIRENWVLVDLLDVYRQLGVDVFGRMRELAKARGLAS